MCPRRFRRWKRVSLILAVCAAAGAFLYLRACQVPGDYAPVALSPEARLEARQSLEDALKLFLSQSGEIGSYDPYRPPEDGHLPPPPRRFKMELTQERLNQWAALISDRLERELRPLDISAPAVAFGRDRLTLYARWDRYDKIIGLDAALKFAPDGALTVELTRARIGRLTLPRALVARRRGEIVGRLQTHIRSIGEGTGSFAGQPTTIFRDASAKAARALAQEPVRLDLPRQIAHVRIRNILLAPGKATLEVVSLLKD